MTHELSNNELQALKNLFAAYGKELTPEEVRSYMADFHFHLEEVSRIIGIRMPPLFHQMSPENPEGSLPLAHTDRGKWFSSVAKFIFGMDPRSSYKAGLDGFGQLAAGLIVYNPSTGVILTQKGDPYKGGKLGVIAGQGRDVDEGDPVKLALRRAREEIGDFEFDPARLIPLCNTEEWRTNDTRLEGYAIWAKFLLYPMSDAEVHAMAHAFKKHRPKDDEVAKLIPFSMREIFSHVRDGTIPYLDQSKAFLRLALCRQKLNTAEKMAALSKDFGMPLTEAQIWAIAALATDPLYQSIIAKDNWRETLNPDDFLR